MAYGTVKVDTVTFTYNAVDATTTFSGFYASTTNNLTLSGTASAATFTGTTANFTNANAQNISVTTLLSGLAITGGTAGFTTVTGTTVTGTTANFVTVSGTTVTGTAAQFTSITGGTAGFTTVTGTTVTGTTANFVTVSGTSITGGTAGFTTVTGTTVTGTTANFVTLSGTTVTGNIGQFTSLTGATTTMTSGVFALGTEPLPSISFVSDPNTGIYSPGADQLAVATNGVERVEFGTAEVVFNDGGENYDFRVESDLESQLFFIDASDNSIGVGTAGNYGDGAILVAALDRATGAGTTNVRLGIGVKELTSGQGRGLWLGARTDENTGVIGTRTASGNLAFETYNGSWGERMRLTYDGKLGIGNSSPSTALDVSGAISLGSVAIPSAGTARIFSRNTDSNLYIQTGSGNTLNLLDGSQNTMASLGSSTVTLQTSNSPRLTITSTGLVGIGTTSPNALLDVRSATTWVGDGTTDAFLQFNQSATAANRWHIGAGSGNAFIFYKGTYGTGVETARIDSSGRLLVGTSTARTDYFNNGLTAMLQVEGTNYGGNVDRACVSIVNNNNVTVNEAPVLILGRSNGSALNSKTLVSSGTRCGYISFQGADGSDLIDAASIAGEIDGTPGANDMPGRLVFSTTPDGGSSPTSSPPAMTIKSSQEVLIGTSTITANGGVLQLKSGITFPATAVAATDVNTLDDYEEGTWTPTQGAGLTVVGTFSSAGHYTKVGRQVTVQGALSSTTTVAAAANAIMCGGLPFGVMNISGSNFIGGGSNVSLSALINVWANQGTANMYSVTAMAATAYLVFTVSYFTE